MESVTHYNRIAAKFCKMAQRHTEIGEYYFFALFNQEMWCYMDMLNAKAKGE